MVVKEKVVVVLLLITIILSIVSVVLTFAINAPNGGSSDSVGAGQLENPEDLYSSGSGQVSFEIKPPA